MLIFSFLTASRGSAIIASGFISTTLVHEHDPVVEAWGGGKRYEDLLIYTAVIMFVASFGALSRFLRRDNADGGESEATNNLGERGIDLDGV